MPTSDVGRKVDHVFYQTLLRVRRRVDRATFLAIAKDLQEIDLGSASRRSLDRMANFEDVTETDMMDKSGDTNGETQ